MKRRVWVYSFIFLVIFQLFSPWMISISSNGVTAKKNIASATVTAGSRGGTVTCSIDAISEKQAFVTIGTAPGTIIKSLGIRRTSDNYKYGKSITLTKKVDNKLFYAIRRSDQHTSGPYYLSNYIIDLQINLMNRSDLYCYVEYKNPNPIYTDSVFITKSTDFTKYKDSEYDYTDPDTNITSKINAKIISPKDFTSDAIQFSPFAMNVLKSRENGKNTFQIAYMFISKNRVMTDGNNPFMNQELSSTLKGGNSHSKIKTSEVSASNVTYYQRYDSKIPGLDDYYEWVFLDKNKIIDTDNNLNYDIDSSIKTDLSFMGAVNATSATALAGPFTWFSNALITYFSSGTTTITYNSIPFQYDGKNNGMHFSGILRDVYDVVKDLQQLAGGGKERFAFGIDKAKSAEGDNGIGIIVALEYGPDDWDEVITTNKPGRTSPTAAEVTESQVFDNYYDVDLLSGQAGKTIIVNKNQINPEWEGFAMVLRKNQTPSTNIKNLDTDAVVMSLNPYLIGDLSNNDPFINQNYNNITNSDGKKAYPFYNQRKIYIPVNIKKDIFGTGDTLKAGDSLYAYVLSREDSSGNSNDAVISTVVKFEITDQINQVGRTYGTIDDISQNKESEGVADWLPTCEFYSPISWVTGCLVQAFYYFFFVTSAKLLEIAGTVLDFVLVYSISPGVYKVGYIVDSWRFIRDICNLFFIFMLVYLAFKIILGAGHNTKQLIVNTIIIATVINFSYPLTTLVIDVSNITARQLYYNSFSKKDEASDKPVGLSTMVASAYNPQELVLGARAENKSDAEGKGSIFMIILMGVIFNCFGIYIFLKVALQFIYRILGLVFAIILSPIALFSYSLESEMRSKLKMVGFDAWLNGLISDCFKAPVFLFLILILALFVAQNPFKGLFGSDVNGIDWWMSIVIPFMIIIGFMQLILTITKKMSSEISSVVGDKIVGGIEKVGGFAIGGAAGLATGGLATLGRNTIGKWAAKSAENTRNSGKDTWWNRQKLRALDSTAKSSFDARQTAAGNALSKATGLNMDNKLVGKIPGMSAAATAGGYMAMKDRKKKKEIDRAKLWGHNKGLEDNLNHEKEHKEHEKSDKEVEAKEQKATVNNLERESKDLEKTKKDADDNFNDIQKLEQLQARKVALKADGKNETEVDQEIATMEQKIISKSSDAVKQKAAANGGKLNPVLIDYVKQKATKEKEDAGAAFNTKTTELNTAKDALKKTEASILELEKGISKITKAISNVKNDRMLEATLRHKRKSTGDKMTAETIEQKYVAKHLKANGGDKVKAEAEAKAEMIKDFGKDNWEKMAKINSGRYADKTGHMHDVGHMIDDHFHPETHKNNYKAPGGGAGHPPAKSGHDKPDAHKEEHH